MRIVFPLLISAWVGTAACEILNPDRQLMTRIPTRLIAPNQQVDRLLSAQRVEDAKFDRFRYEQHTKQERMNRTEQLLSNPESLYPGHADFLLAMAKQPAEAIPANVYLRWLQDSNVKCSSPLYTTNFIKVRVTSGPLDGHVGWVCEDDIFRTVVWP